MTPYFQEQLGCEGSMTQHRDLPNLPVVAYLRADKDGNPIWSEDCVCQDPVYPSDPDGSDADSVSMPLVRLSDVIAALTSPAARPEQAGPDHKFKNFHRLLCERFGYTHDERDWMRDQISLIEHIAKKLPPQALTDEQTQAAVDAWFDEYQKDGATFKTRMQAAISAALAQQAAQAPCGTVTAYEDSTGQHYQFTPSWGWVGTRRFDVFEAPPAQAQQPSTHWTEREPVRLAASRVGRVYLAGPMTGYAEFNFPAFNAEAAMLRGQGLSVLNPAEHGIVDGAEWADYLRHDIAGLASCERIHLLRGWEKSKGAQLEVTIAQALGMQITHQEGAEPAHAAQSDPVKPLFASKVAARKWSELQEAGARMQSIAFDGHKSGQPGTIDPWGVVRWGEQAAQGAGEVVAWQHQKPIEGPTGEIEGYTDWMDGDGSPWWPRRALYTHPTPPPAQPAPVVPDVQREIADALALFPVDLESKTFRVNVYNQSQVIEADGDTQFFSKKKVMALLEKLHGHLTAAATPTPPAQAAADARDAERYRMVRRGQHWSVITGIGDTLRGEDLDAAIDAVSVGQR